MKISHLIVGLACPVIVWAQAGDVYTNVEAVRKAESIIKRAHALHTKVAEICSDANATGLLYEVAENAIRDLDSWPDDHQKSQNLAAYDACRQSMVDVQSYAYTCASDGYKGKAATYIQRRWVEDSTGCDSAIRASDLSREDSN
ncbi:hypothetical protein [Aquipseudomonas alcaligenes]|uniref:hypothetical protein n=1 Tax=Aquipseudomonas alcaligenes TaxID=43263 RepID=UPI001658E75A|nr:hypothetical protein [Pseudomonas alcaligenes]